ncbi:uncharacterized protein LOC128677321 [Plodia interpunctella]|uniref:uncharacterized protein LOC128677321 n=1 Tax=Plodia interpunctella TaxID=58824 RepID=UPI0023684277|nr:uncharacterized protein LOC128677321 [Plodia interpunctella]
MSRLRLNLKLITLTVVLDLTLGNSVDDCTTRSNLHRPTTSAAQRKDVKFNVHGLVPSVFTAFHDDYSINYDVIPAYAKHLAHSNFSGILVGGTTGQHMALSLEDRKNLIDAWVKVAKVEGLRTFVQVGGAAYPDVMELAKYSEESGADAILTLPDLYFRPKTIDELVCYVQDVSNAAPKTPILYYHTPNATNVKLDMPAFVAAASARIPNFKGIKSTSPDLEEEVQLRKILREDQEFFRGGHALIASSLSLGGRSFMTPAITLFPRISQDLYHAGLNNEVETARELQKLLNMAVEAHLTEGPFNPTVRAGLEIMTGLKMGPPARPLRPISADAKRRIHDRLIFLKLTKSIDTISFVDNLFKRQSPLGMLVARSCQQSISRLIGKMVSFNFQGLMPAMFTALNDDYSVNYDIIPSYAKFMADSGMKSILVGGTTGEHVCFSVETRKKLISEWVKVAKPLGLHVQVHVGGTAFPNVIELAKHAEKVGADSIITLPELYFKPASVDDLVFYLEKVAKAAPTLPVLFYHNPKRSKVEMDMPKFIEAATARIPNFKGIKFAVNDLSIAKEALKKHKEGQVMFFAGDTLVAPAVLMGIRCTMCTSFSLFPRLALDIVQAAEAGDVKKAMALQEKLTQAVEAHLAEGDWVPALKAGMELATGLNMGPPAIPNRPVSPEGKQRIYTKLKQLGLVN